MLDPMIMAPAAASAAMATTIAQIDIPHPVPQTGAQGSQGASQGEGAQGVAGVGGVAAWQGVEGGHVVGSLG